MSIDPGAQFRQYESDYKNKSLDISNKIGHLPTFSGGNRISKMEEVEKLISAADTLIKKMEMEAGGLPQPSAKTFLAQVKTYKSDLAGLKDSFKKAASASSSTDAARAELGLGAMATSAAERGRMENATQIMEQSTNKLVAAKDQLDQTINLGADVMTELDAQRTKLLGASNTLKGADDNITKARTILSNMARRIWQNKIIFFGIILLLLFAIGIILYVKLRPHNDDD